MLFTNYKWWRGKNFNNIFGVLIAGQVVMLRV